MCEENAYLHPINDVSQCIQKFDVTGTGDMVEYQKGKDVIILPSRAEGDTIIIWKDGETRIEKFET